MVQQQKLGEEDSLVGGIGAHSILLNDAPRGVVRAQGLIQQVQGRVRYGVVPVAVIGGISKDGGGSRKESILDREKNRCSVKTGRGAELFSRPVPSLTKQ